MAKLVKLTLKDSTGMRSPHVYVNPDQITYMNAGSTGGTIITTTRGAVHVAQDERQIFAEMEKS